VCRALKGVIFLALNKTKIFQKPLKIKQFIENKSERRTGAKSL
jgi:hypothetical protein